MVSRTPGPSVESKSSLSVPRFRDEAQRLRRDAERFTGAQVRRQMLAVAAQDDVLAKREEHQPRWSQWSGCTARPRPLDLLDPRATNGNLLDVLDAPLILLRRRDRQFRPKPRQLSVKNRPKLPAVVSDACERLGHRHAGRTAAT